MMDRILTLLFLGSLTTSSAWKIGEQLDYSYSGVSMAGIPTLSKTYAVNEIKGKLVVQAVDEETLSVQLSGVSVTADPSHNGSPYSSNFRLGANARKLELSDGASLERPFQIKHNSGSIKNIQVSASDPVWAVNFKKAVASSLQLDLSAVLDQSSLVKEVLYRNEEEANTGVTTVENTILGNCATGIRVTRLTGAQLISDKKSELLEKLCDADSSVYKISKLVNYDSCTNRPVLNVVMPPTITCKPGGSKCGDSIQQLAAQNFYACKLPAGDLKIIHVKYLNEFFVAPFGSKSEALFSGGLVRTVLDASGEITAPLAVPENPVIHSSLAYVFPETADVNGTVRVPGYEDAPLTRPANILSLEKSIVNQVREITAALGKDASLEADFDFTNRLSEVRRFFSQLKLSEIQSIMKGLDTTETPTARQVLMDILATAGTPATAKFVADWLRSGTLWFAPETSSTVDVAMMLFNYINVPTKELLADLVDVVTSLEKGDKNLHSTCIMGLSELLYHACGSPYLEQRRFSTRVYGSFCTTEDESYKDYVEYLTGLLNGATTNFEKMAYLTATGTLGTKDIFPLLLPYIRGVADQSAAVRTRAILALHRYAYSAPEKVIPVMTALYENTAENPEVRMAALALLLNSNAPYDLWQKVAVATWTEPNNQVAAFTFSLVQNLARLPESIQYSDLIGKAKTALNMMKKFKLSTLYSRSTHIGEWLEEINAGHLIHIPIWKTGYQKGPVASGFRAQAQLGPHVFTYFQIYRWSYGFEELKQKVAQAFSKPIKQGRPRESISFAATELDSLFKHLGIQGPPKEEINTFLQFGFGANMHRLFSFDDADKSLPKFLKSIHDAISKDGGYDASVQKFRSWADVLVSVPTVLGVSVSFEATLPSIESCQYNIKGRVASLRDLEFNKDGNGIMSWAYVATLGISLPFSKSVVAVGVESRTDIRDPYNFGLFRKVNDYENIDAYMKVVPRPEKNDFFFNRVVPFRIGGESNDFKPLFEKTGFSVIHLGEATIENLSPIAVIPITVTSERPAKDKYSFTSILTTVFEMGYPKNLHYHVFKSSYAPRKVALPELKISFNKVRGFKYNPEAFKFLEAGTGSVASRPVAAPIEGYDFEADEDILGGYYGNRKLALSIGGKEAVSASLNIAQDFENTVRKIAMTIKGGTYSGCVTTKQVAPLLSRFEDSPADLQSTISLLFAQGEDCSVKVAEGQILLSRTPEQLEYSAASEAGKACVADVAEGILDSKDCWKARRLADTYDKINMDIARVTENEVFEKMISHFTSQIRARNPDAYFISKTENNEDLEVETQFKPSGESYSIVSRLNGEETTYSNIPVKYPTLAPANARKNSWDDVLEYVTRGSESPICYVSSNRVQTFDGLSYDYAIDECDHLLASDCSGIGKIAIIARKNAFGNLTIRVITELDRMEIDANGVADLNKKVTVRLNKEGVITVKSGKASSVVYKRKTGEIVFVSAVANIAVYFKDNLVTVKSSLNYPGQMCGLCGDSNYEQSKEFASPKRCALRSGALMAASYRVKSARCTPLPSTVQDVLTKTEKNCQSVDAIIRSALPIVNDNCKLKRRRSGEEIVCGDTKTIE